MTRLDKIAYVSASIGNSQLSEMEALAINKAVGWFPDEHGEPSFRLSHADMIKAARINSGVK